MPTYLVSPPPPQQRMAFMDALDEANIDYSREFDGYFIYLRKEQTTIWEQIQRLFNAQIAEDNPL